MTLNCNNNVRLSRSLSRSLSRCKWRKGWKSQKQVSFVYVAIQTEVQVPNQNNEQPTICESPVGDRCATVKLEPM